jgi:hypothetical protein
MLSLKMMLYIVYLVSLGIGILILLRPLGMIFRTLSAPVVDAKKARRWRQCCGDVLPSASGRLHYLW